MTPPKEQQARQIELANRILREYKEQNVDIDLDDAIELAELVLEE